MKFQDDILMLQSRYAHTRDSLSIVLDTYGQPENNMLPSFFKVGSINRTNNIYIIKTHSNRSKDSF